MAEKQVTLEGETYKLPKPFFVIATQNPVEQFGTFPLPESQMDRFMMKISIGYPTREAEKEILKGGSRREELYRIQPVMDPDEVIKIQNEIDQVYISDRVIDYILDIAEVTRSGKFFSAGLSIRGTLALVKTAKTNAYFKGRDFVIPEDIKELAVYTIPHRVLFKEEYESMEREEIIRSVLEEIKLPA